MYSVNNFCKMCSRTILDISELQADVQTTLQPNSLDTTTSQLPHKGIYAPVLRGNVGGRYEKKKWFQVSEEPVHKKRKPKK